MLYELCVGKHMAMDTFTLYNIQQNNPEVWSIMTKIKFIINTSEIS